MFKVSDSVIVSKNGTVRYGTIAKIMLQSKGTLYTIAYRDPNHIFYRSYYDTDSTVVIEKDHAVYSNS